MTKEVGELANKWAMNRYRLPNSHPDGMDSKEFFEFLGEDISNLVKKECISFAEWITNNPDQWSDADGRTLCSQRLYEKYLTRSN